MSKQKLTPTGLKFGVFKISIDDGFVEFEYKIRPKKGNHSITDIHKSICQILGARVNKGKIRKQTSK